jgi:hypothetical protein
MLKSEFLSSVAGLGVLVGSLDSCRIIQGMSAELKRGDKRYIPDAKIGAFYFEGRDPPTIDGEEGFDAIWAHVHAAVIESPADGSFATLAKYKAAPGDAVWKEELDENGRKRNVYRRAGNRNILKRTLFGAFVLVDENGYPDFDAIYELPSPAEPQATSTATSSKPSAAARCGSRTKTASSTPRQSSA